MPRKILRRSGTRPRFLASAAACALLALAIVPPALAAPIDVTHSVSIEHGNWTPLSVEEMKRASVDPALARLSDAGRLRFLDSETQPAPLAATGKLAIAIHLIGPAETAKVTMTLDAPGSPTLVATAAISVRGLDHQGIFEAFEHVGERTADRLAAKLDHLASAPVSPAASKHATQADPKRRQAYEAAQSAKRAERYAEARAGFESVAASSDDPEDRLRRLAEDELRYGLPLFEAQQALNHLGRMARPNQQATRNAALSRAENLYRQIEAENQDSFERITEAQRAIDGMLVMRRALANAMRANMMSRAMSIRMEIMQFSMMEGVCPGASFVEEVLSRRPNGLALSGRVEPAPGQARYRIEEAETDFSLDLLCGPDGVEVAPATGSLREGPAAAR